MAAVQFAAGRLPRATVLQRLSRLVSHRRVLVDPAALLAEPFSPPAQARVLLGETPGRLYLLEADYLERLRGLPETVSAADIAACLERAPREAMDSRFLPLDHPEGIIARFNYWFYLGKGERAFAEGQVPTGLARDRHLVRAEAALLKRLAAGGAEPTVLKLGAGCDVEPVRLLFEGLERLEPNLAARTRVVMSDVSPPLVAEAGRRSGLDPLLSGLAERGQLTFEVIDAREPELEGRKFLLIQSSYLYDSLPQRELALVGGRWYEFKTRPRLLGCSQREEFLRLLLANDLAGLQQVITHHFGYLDWEVVLDPLAPEDVPHREELEAICGGSGDVAVPLGDALIAGFEALLPHLAPGGVVQTFDLGIVGLGAGDPHLKPAFRGPHRICAALFLGQNFALAGRVFSQRGFEVSLLAPDKYLEQMLGEEIISLDRLWEALHQGSQALDGLLGPGFGERYRGCLEGEGGSVLRRIAQGHFLTRSEAEAMVQGMAAVGQDGAGFVAALLGVKERLGEIEANTYLQFRLRGTGA
jgi:hypothetical protein